MSSEHAWIAANRIAGWGLVLTGLVVIAACAFLAPADAVVAMFAGLAASFVIAIAVSYLAWRRDPERAD